jgi:hypothetical protein
VQPAAAVPRERKQRERRGEAVRDAGLHRNLRLQLPQHRIEIDAFRVTDRAERMAAAADLVLVLARLLEEMLKQPARSHLALVLP